MSLRKYSFSELRPLKAGIRTGGFIDGMATDLIYLLGLAILALSFVFIPYASRTIIVPYFGLILLSTLAGYSLLAALLPEKGAIDTVGRLLSSFSLGIAITFLVGLMLKLLLQVISIELVSAYLAVFICVCILAVVWRRHDIPPDGQFRVSFNKMLKGAAEGLFQANGTVPEKALTAILLVSVLASVAMVTYIIVSPMPGEGYTEFYILGPDGSADGYPVQFYSGENVSVIVGIVNHEHKNMTYDLVVWINDSTRKNILHTERLAIADNETWEKLVNLKPSMVGPGLRVEFLLYKDEALTIPYRELYLRVNVMNPGDDQKFSPRIPMN